MRQLHCRAPANVIYDFLGVCAMFDYDSSDEDDEHGCRSTMMKRNIKWKTRGKTKKRTKICKSFASMIYDPSSWRVYKNVITTSERRSLRVGYVKCVCVMCVCCLVRSPLARQKVPHSIIPFIVSFEKAPAFNVFHCFLSLCLFVFGFCYKTTRNPTKNHLPFITVIINIGI